MFVAMTETNRNIAPHLRLPGRAAGSNQVGRFERYQRDHFCDDWDIAEEPVTLRTVVSEERPRSVITRNSSPDIPFDRSINPYRGCEHGCVYCFARPTHAYLGLSPGLDFDTRLVARPGAEAVLRRELSKPSYRVAPIAIGTNTDPYQPIEAKYRVMRNILAVLQEFRHPVTLVTKGALVERDIDILGEMAKAGLAHVGISVTTLDARLSRRLEPRAPAPARRLAMIERLSAAGIPVRTMIAPVIPAVTDHEVEAILAASSEAGAQAATWIMLRLPREVSPIFQDWLAVHLPDRAARVMGLIRAMHDGRDYSPEWGKRMRGAGSHADMIAHRFKIAAKRLGMDGDLAPLNCDAFRVPGRGRQLPLF